MNSSLDLNLLFLARQGGLDTANLPDLYAVTPPRHTARGREDDSLIIYLSMTGNSPLTPHAQTQLMEQLADKFYKATGSLTSALRTVVEALNLYLLDRNLRSTSMGRQGIGQLILAALRSDTLYLTQCGPVHAFTVTPTGTQHLYEPQSSGRGLGLSRTTPMRFLQIKMDPDDYLILATQVPQAWMNYSLQHPQGLGIEALRRQLLENGDQEFNAVIVQAQSGTGKLKLLKRKAEAPDMANATLATQPVEPSTPEGSVSRPAEDRRPGLPPVTVPIAETATQLTEDRKLGIPPSPPSPTPAAPTAAPVAAGSQPEPAQRSPQTTVLPTAAVTAAASQAVVSRGETGAVVAPTPSPATKESKPKKSPRAAGPSPWAKSFDTFRRRLALIGAAILKALRNALGTLAGALLRLLKSLLPDADVLRVPPSAMIFIALAIPLILATIGGMVYLQRGRSQQHEIYYQQAVEDADYADTLTNPLEQRMAWLTVIGDLDKADNYTTSTESQALRTQANASLDNLDATKRLDYQQAIVGGLDSAVRVTRMVATATDLYLLNAAQGTVLRAIITGRGYEIDPNFQCGPTFGPIDVGPLIDIAELPPGSFENASLLAMDASGNLLYCVVGSQPYSATMAPPNTGFGEPMGMALDRSDLYVLDPAVNAVWLYPNLEVSQQPHLFFGEEIPPMADVIDLVAYNEDIYLLHADGHITKCTYSGLTESPTRCEDPYPYSDNRPGRVHGPTIEDTVFSQIYFLSFPERSIYLLDPQNQAIYYFSVLLNLQCQYQPKSPLADGAATAFAISPNRTAFLAIGNYVYYAAMP